jgi:hypothetical protein
MVGRMAAMMSDLGAARLASLEMWIEIGIWERERDLEIRKREKQRSRKMRFSRLQWVDTELHDQISGLP